MKNLYILLICVFSFVLAEDNKLNLKIDGMQCSYSCSGKVSKIVQDIKGVKNCEVDFAKGSALVTFDNENLTAQNIIDVITENSSYKAKVDEKTEDIVKENSSI